MSYLIILYFMSLLYVRSESRQDRRVGEEKMNRGGRNSNQDVGKSNFIERGEGCREGESGERERKPLAELPILCYILVNIQLSCIMALPVKTFLDSNEE